MPALHKDNPNITSSSALFPRKNILHSAERIVFSRDNGNALQLFAGMEGCVHLGAQPTCGAVHAPAVKEQHQPVREGESHLQRRQETAFRTVPSHAFEGKAMLAEHPGSSVTAGPRGSVTPVGNPTVLATTWGMSKCCCQVPKTGTMFANHRHAMRAWHAMLLRGALTYPCHSQPAMSHRPACTARNPRDGSSWQAGTSCWVLPGACSETGSGSRHLGARCAPLPPTGFFCLALPWQAAPDAPTDARCCPSRWKPAVPFHQHRPKSAASAPHGGALCPGDGWKGVSQPPNVTTSG